MLKFSIVIPTYNAEPLWKEWVENCQKQTLKPNQVLVIDSSSQDNTVELALKAGFSVTKIDKKNFNHGATRNLALNFIPSDTEIIVYLTQDALLADPYSLENLLKPFSDPKVGAVYGRQVPHKNANPLAIHARLFNYPNKTIVKQKEDIKKLGIKTAFISNSFAAYRKDVFIKLGGFPNDTILAEDMYLAAKMILNDYKVVYCSEATVFHSHNYSVFEEFKRYFDIGVFQKQNKWILDNFGLPTSEGKAFVKAELLFLVKNNPLWIPRAIVHTIFKYLGIKLGMNWYKIPKKFIKKLSMNPSYWK